MSLQIRGVNEEAELREFARVHATAFGHRFEQEKLEKLVLPWLPVVNCVAAFDDGSMVGVSIDLPLTMTLPGGAMLPIRGITWVGVLPTYRRRGVLRALMDHQHAEFEHDGVAVSALYAADTRIYGRFGYGPATVVASEAEVDVRFGAFAQPFQDPGQVVMIEDRSPVAIVREVLDRARPRIPGEVDRMQQDLADMFTAADEKQFRVAHRDAEGGWDGFVTYTFEMNWQHEAIAQNRVVVGTMLTAGPDAHAALWRYLLDLDLVRTVRVRNRPLDDPIRWLLAEWRHYRVNHVSDGVWLRLLDLPAALAARGYLHDGELVLDVDGSRWLLEVRDGHGSCAPTRRDAEIELDTATLASTYLGGYRLTALREGRRLRELAPGACVRADSMFRAEREPWCSHDF